MYKNKGKKEEQTRLARWGEKSTNEEQGDWKKGRFEEPAAFYFATPGTRIHQRCEAVFLMIDCLVVSEVAKPNIHLHQSQMITPVSDDYTSLRWLHQSQLITPVSVD